MKTTHPAEVRLGLIDARLKDVLRELREAVPETDPDRPRIETHLELARLAIRHRLTDGRSDADFRVLPKLEDALSLESN